MTLQVSPDRTKGTMSLNQFLAAVCLAIWGQFWLAAPANASSFADQIVAQLSDQGFADIEIERTWLGRTRILALRGGAQREIIVNATTGEILRDLWLNDKGKENSSVRIRNDDRSGPGSDRNGGGDHSGGDDENDDNSGGDDDDDDDDNSGSGSGDD